jgi:hypothetical protein
VSRQRIATAAVRAITIWMIVQGVAAGAGSLVFLTRARSLGGPEQLSLPETRHALLQFGRARGDS